MIELTWAQLTILLMLAFLLGGSIAMKIAACIKGEITVCGLVLELMFIFWCVGFSVFGMFFCWER